MALDTHQLGLVAEAECPHFEVANLSFHLSIHCFTFRECSPIPFSSKLFMVAQSMSWWYACSSVEFSTMRQIFGTMSYWCLVPNIVIIKFSIVDEILCNASSKPSFWKVTLSERKMFEKIKCKHTLHLRQCNKEPKLLQFPTTKISHFLKGKLTLMFVVVVINNMTTKIIQVMYSELLTSINSNPTWHFLFAFGRVVNHVFAMI